MGDATYLFIDGGYLQTVYRDVFVPVFGGTYEVDYKAVMNHFGARRAYLYDCLDDVRKEGESETDYNARVKREEDRFDAMDKVEGLHVRYGYVTTGKKRQQKEVDVLLAVDMLTHSFNKNMDSAVLLSGDRDFKPVVESIVQLGTCVKVAYDPRISSRPLVRAADSEMEISISDLCQWIRLEAYDERSKHFPTIGQQQNRHEDPYKNVTGYRAGVIGPAKLPLGWCKLDTRWFATVRTNRRDYREYSYHDEQKFTAYLNKQYGDIVWS